MIMGCTLGYKPDSSTHTNPATAILLHTDQPLSSVGVIFTPI